MIAAGGIRAARRPQPLLQQVDDPQHDPGHWHVDEQVEVKEREVADLRRRARVERHVEREPDIRDHEDGNQRRRDRMGSDGTP